jgi:Methylamine utilisation protein MauE
MPRHDRGVILIPLVLRAALAVTFATAATLKALAPASTRESLAAFGAPRRLVGVAAFVLPAVEALVAVALIVQPTAVVGAWVALALLLGFTAAIAAALHRGEAPPCNCFGPATAAPVGPATLARNSVLAAAAAAAAVFGPGESIGRALAGVSAGAIAAVAALILVLAALAAFCWQLMRQNGRLLTRVDALEELLGVRREENAATEQVPAGLPLGEPAPSFVFDGRSLPAAGEPLVVTFTDPDCGACREVGPLVVRARETGTVVVELQDRELAIAYRAHGVPAAVGIDEAGLIASELVHGTEAIERLLAASAPGSLLTVVQR